MPNALRLSVVALAATLGLAFGCESGNAPRYGPAGPSAKPGGPDRLAAGELAPGTVQVFGFVAPRELALERRFPDAAHFTGTVPAESIANYVRQRVEAERVEIGAARTVFPAAHIKGGAPDRIFRIEVLSDGPISKLVIRDITPPPLEPGLSEEERWRRAGFGPDGKVLNR